MLGLSRKQVSREGIFTPSRGIRLPLHSTGTVADNVRAYCRLDPVSVLTHSTSARIFCICLPAWLDQDWRIHIARPACNWKPRRLNVVGHQLSFKPGEVVMVDGVRLTSPARTWLDLASVLSIYPEQRTALQYDGVHHGESGQYLRDITRQTLTESLGWREVRVQKSDLEGARPFVVEKVRSALGRSSAARTGR